MGTVIWHYRGRSAQASATRLQQPITFIREVKVMSNNDEHSFLLLERLVDGEPRRDPDLSLSEFNGAEGVSAPFNFELGAFSSNRNIRYEDYIGQNVTVSTLLANGERRYFNGLISRFAQVSGGEEGRSAHHMSYYTATMVPWLWLLTKYANSRIFQNKTVQQIVDEILTSWDLSDHADYVWDLEGNYEERTYCVQYRETDFNFISRLLEEEGIFYFFRHEQGRHTLVLANAPSKHPECPHQNTARCEVRGYFDSQEPDVITSFQKMQEIRFGKCTLNDFNFEMPGTNLTVEAPGQHPLGQGERELYDYPGLYINREGGERFVNIRMQEEEAKITTITGSGFCRAFLAGTKVKVVDPHDYYRDDLADSEGKDYILVSVSHMASQTVGPSGSAEGEGTAYANTFTCIPFEVPYRPPRYTPKPVVQGSQTAIVVGSSEIDPDEYGRVKVQFHWDRDGNRSCWIRVSQLWAGEGWGAMFIPRVGHEVIVDFLEGDPDRPIITGRVYHGKNDPPYSLPNEKTKSTIKSNSSPGGGGSNEIRFDDNKENEEIFIHAQKDLNTIVEAAESHTVGTDRTVHVQGHFEETIDSGEDRTVDGGVTETISGGETRTVNDGQTETISGGETRNITGDQTETITGAVNQTVTGGVKVTTPGTFEVTATGGVRMVAPAGYQVVAPGGHTQVDNFWDAHGYTHHTAYASQISVRGLINQAFAVRSGVRGFDQTITNFRHEYIGVHMGQKGVQDVNVVANNGRHVLNCLAAGLHIFR